MTEDITPYRVDPPLVQLAAETMHGDLINALLDELKAAHDVWPKLSQVQQDQIIFRFEKRVGEAIRDAVRMIASDGRPCVSATLEQITAKDGIKAVLTLPKTHSRRHDLLDAVGQTVLIVVADAESYLGGDKPEGEPDQRPLALAGADEAPAPATDAPEPENAPLEALEAGIEDADEDVVVPQRDQDAPDPAPTYGRDDGRVYEAILMIDEEWTGFGADDALNLSRISQWTDEDCALVEAFCQAVAENPDNIPVRPEVIGGPLPMQVQP